MTTIPAPPGGTLYTPITQLPSATLPLQGTESMVVVQNGQTCVAPASAVASASGALSAPSYIVVATDPHLANDRALVAGTGLALLDNGAGATLVVGASGQLSALALLGGRGFVIRDDAGIRAGSISGDNTSIVVVNGSASGGPPVVSVATDATFPGTGGVRVPGGSTAQRPVSPDVGRFRYNSQTNQYEAWYSASGEWRTFSASGNLSIYAKGAFVGVQPGLNFSSSDLSIVGGVRSASGIVDITISLSGSAAISGQTLTNITVVGNSTWSGGQIIGATTSGETINNATINSPTISGGSIVNATTSGETIIGPSVSGGVIRSSTLSGVTILGNSTFSGGSISGANLDGVNVVRSTWSGGSINGASINGSTYSGGTFSGVTIIGATISGGTIINATTSGETINNAVINSSTISGGTLRASTLSGVTILGNSTFSGGSITGSTLDGVVVVRSTFSGGNVNGATASGLAVSGGSSTWSGDIPLLVSTSGQGPIFGGSTVSTLELTGSGVFVNLGSRPQQAISNSGAMMVTGPTSGADGNIILLIRNVSGAGAISFSSNFTVSGTPGDAFTTNSGAQAVVSVIRIAGINTYVNKQIK